MSPLPPSIGGTQGRRKFESERLDYEGRGWNWLILEKKSEGGSLLGILFIVPSFVVVSQVSHTKCHLCLSERAFLPLVGISSNSKKKVC